MDEISKLIKEAKPLYFKRKRRNMRIKNCVVALFISSIFLLSSFGGYTIGERSVSVSSEEGYSQFDELGFPTDEYGLLTVRY